MNIEERRTFWETLCSLERTNPEEDCQRIRDSIKFPDKLYRYRSNVIKPGMNPPKKIEIMQKNT